MAVLARYYSKTLRLSLSYHKLFLLPCPKIINNFTPLGQKVAILYENGT